MKTLHKLLFTSVLVFSLILGCSTKDDTIEIMEDDFSQTDDGPDGPPDDGESIDFEQIAVTISLPSGMDLDLSKVKVNSHLQTFDVDGNGQSNAIIADNNPSFVYVTDEADNIILMGYVSKSNPEIDMISTLEASLFYSLGTVFRPKMAKLKFLDEFRGFAKIQPFVNELEDMFRADPLTIQSEEYNVWLNAVANDLSESNKDEVDIGTSILIDDTNQKSGVTLKQDDNDIFGITALNYWRRRAHAFLYKTEVKKEGNEEFEQILDPKTITVNNVQTDLGIVVAPVTGLTSIQGNLVDVAFGNGLNLGFTSNGPLSLPLNNDEVASKYFVRVVGMGKGVGNLTTDETSKLRKLQVETLAFDIAIPAICNTIGILDINDTFFEVDSMLEVGNAILAGSPNIIDALDDGDIKTAGIEFVKAAGTNFLGSESFFKLVLKGLAKAGSQSASNLLGDEKALGKALAPLTIVNAGMTATDVIRVIVDFNAALRLETFDITVTRGKVRIDPRVKGILKGKSVTLTANVVDDEDIQEGEYTYEWITSGQYGNFDEASTTDKIVYKSDSSIELPNDAKEQIFVEVFKDGSLVGKDSATVNISATEYRIRPDGITLSGDNKATLRIVDLEGKVLQNNDLNKFKVVWSTEGKHGKLNGSARQLTTYDGHSLSYECFDKETEMGVETITAEIYLEITILDASGNPSSTEYEPYDTVTAEINIENDERILRYYTPVGYDSSGPFVDGIYHIVSVWSTWEWNSSAAEIPEGYEVERVSMKVEEYITDVIPSCTSTSDSWFLNDGENMQETYSVSCSYSGGSFLTGGDAADYLSYLIGLYGAKKGYAMVTVHLRPKN